MKISIVNTAYNMPLSTVRLFETAMKDADKHDISFNLFLHSQHEETRKMCESLSETFPTVYHAYGKNRGLSRSWNEGVLEAYDAGADVVIVANDDVYFSPGDIHKIATKAVACRENYIVSVAGFHVGANSWEPSHGYSCFALNPITIDTIGCFDENIFPIYMEDCDHHYRATLAGLVEENCSDTKVFHEGSSAINNDDMLSIQNMVTQRKNGIYYREKWGALNEQEVFTVPFDNPKFDLRIAPEDRHSPYGPGYDREDYEEFLSRSR